VSAQSVHPAADAGHLDNPALYRGVLTRRALGFCLDYVFVALLTIPVAILIFFLGILTLGLGWGLYAIIVPLIVVPYVWRSLGGPNQATPGMRMMGVRLERLDGERVDGMLAVVHTVLFWAGNVVLTPFILLAALFMERKRTVHDWLLGTVVVRDRF
jgi:uncharacterized RDD family membrane protein YckC